MEEWQSCKSFVCTLNKVPYLELPRETMFPSYLKWNIYIPYIAKCAAVPPNNVPFLHLLCSAFTRDRSPYQNELSQTYSGLTMPSQNLTYFKHLYLVFWVMCFHRYHPILTDEMQLAFFYSLAISRTACSRELCSLLPSVQNFTARNRQATYPESKDFHTLHIPFVRIASLEGQLLCGQDTKRMRI